ERILVRAGTQVTVDAVILELSNPSVEQELQDAQLRLKSADASLTNLRVQLESDHLQKEASTSQIESDYKKAVLQAQGNQQLADQELVSALTLQQSQLDKALLESRFDIAKKQLAKDSESVEARIASQQADVDQIRALVRLKQRQVDDLRVRAGADGVLQL